MQHTEETTTVSRACQKRVRGAVAQPLDLIVDRELFSMKVSVRGRRLRAGSRSRRQQF